MHSYYTRCVIACNKTLLHAITQYVKVPDVTRFSRLANGRLRVLQRPVIAQQWDRALSRESPPSHALFDPNSMLCALLTRLFAASNCARASLAMPAMKCHRKLTLYQRLPPGSGMAQLHSRTTPPPCTRASRSALKPVSSTRRAPLDAGLGSASSTPFTVLNAFCTILVRSAFPFLTTCNFGSSTATCPSRRGGC